MDGSLTPAFTQETHRYGDGGEAHEDEDIAVIGDTISVGCGDDAEVAVARVKAHVFHEAAYGITISPGRFKLQGDLTVATLRRKVPEFESSGG